MIIINLNKLIKQVEFMCRAILFPESKIVIACNKDTDKQYFKELSSLVNSHPQIKNEIIDTKDDNENNVIRFKNGSYIEIVTPKEKDENVIRGKRSDIKHWLIDWEQIDRFDKDELDEILKPYIT